MQLSPIIEQFGPGNQSWLGSRWGVDHARTITLNATAVADSVVNGYLPSGTPLAENFSTGMFEPYDSAGTGGTAYTALLAGFLVADVPVVTAPGITGIGNIVGALLDMGRIVIPNLPVASFPTPPSASPVTSGLFIFVNHQ